MANDSTKLFADIDRFAPGNLSAISHIPLVFTSAHNEVYYYWEKSGIKDGLLIHVDRHDDLSDGAPLSYGTSDYYLDLQILNFIAPGFHYGIVDEAIWMNPYSDEPSWITYLGKNKSSIKTVVRDNQITWDYSTDFLYQLNGNPMKLDRVYDKELQFILDIDLDAFLLSDRDNRPIDLSGYKRRIDKTIDALRYVRDSDYDIKRPDLITVTSSQYPICYVPPDRIDQVYGYLQSRLIGIY
ncbi:MAG: UPF0489 family protein [Candidatus Woesearchaeota archaeon]|nr:UPF0489 family protein [Candidatus Woesearchaeota archaeon]